MMLAPSQHFDKYTVTISRDGSDTKFLAKKKKYIAFICLFDAFFAFALRQVS